MGKVRLGLLKLLLFFIFTQGMWERIFESNMGIISLEISAILFIISSLNVIRINTPGFSLLVYSLISSFIILLFSGSDFTTTIKYSRYIVYFYLIYNALFHSIISTSEWRKIFKFLIAMVILQGVGSAYTIFIIGEKVEGFVGLMSSLGGTTATIFPLLILTLVLYFILNYKLHKSYYLLLIILVISSFFVSFSSGKRAIYFVIPLFIIITFIISYFINSNKKQILRKALYLTSIIILLLPIYVFGIKKSHGLNYDLLGNENFGQIITKSFLYAQEYESSESSEGLTIGRSNTTGQIISKSLSNSNLFLFGKGFGVSKDENVREEFGFSYGLVGFTRDLLNGGWIYAIISVLLFFKLILYNYKNSSQKVKTLKLILLAVFIFTHFMYSSDFTVSLKINIFYAIICVFISSYNSKSSLNLFQEKFSI